MNQAFWDAVHGKWKVKSFIAILSCLNCLIIVANPLFNIIYIFVSDRHLSGLPLLLLKCLEAMLQQLTINPTPWGPSKKDGTSFPNNLETMRTIFVELILSRDSLGSFVRRTLAASTAARRRASRASLGLSTTLTPHPNEHFDDIPFMLQLCFSYQPFLVHLWQLTQKIPKANFREFLYHFFWKFLSSFLSKKKKTSLASAFGEASGDQYLGMGDSA